MIDAGPSWRAAEALSASALGRYLRAGGWGARPSRLPGVTIFSLDLDGADEPIIIVLPEAPGYVDEKRRIADALRTLEAVEERPLEAVAADVREIERAAITTPA